MYSTRKNLGGTNLYHQYKKPIFKNISMQTYQSVSIVHNVAQAGAFVLTQLAIVWVFKTELAPAQYAGILTVVIGMALIGAGSPANA